MATIGSLSRARHTVGSAREGGRGVALGLLCITLGYCHTCTRCERDHPRPARGRRHRVVDEASHWSAYRGCLRHRWHLYRRNLLTRTNQWAPSLACLGGGGDLARRQRRVRHLVHPKDPAKSVDSAYCRSVLIGFLLALGCSVCYGTATVLQAVAARSVERGSNSGVDTMLLLRAVRQWRYLAGIGLDGLGFLLQVVALRMVPIYVVAAALAASIAVTGVVSAWVLSARLSSIEWTAVAVVCVSLVALACAAGPGHFRHAPAGLGWALIGVVVAVFVAGASAGRLPDRERALALGLAAGTGFGVVEIGVRLIDVIDPTKAAFYANPAVYAAGGGGVAGFLLLTSALQRGSVTTTVAAMVVGETIAPALVGVIWLGDTARAGLGWLVITGFVVAVSGTLGLARFGEAPTPAESS
jgi:drug/metabolite transporter (DMT)-like permease